MRAETKRYITDNLGPQAHMDAGETAFFLRELESIEAKTYDILYPGLKGRTLIPLGTGVSPADEFYTWRQFDRKGEAREGGTYSKDVPLVEVQGKEQTSQIVPVFTGYEYTVQDIRVAMKLQRPLDAMKAAAARDVFERKIEKMSAIGSDARADNKVYGFLNAPAVVANSTYDVSSSAGSGTKIWGPGGKKPIEIIADLNAAFNQMMNNTLGVHVPDTLVLDIVSYNYLACTPVNAADTTIYSSETILSYIMKSIPWLKSVESWDQCGGPSGVFTGPGTGNGNMGVLYEKKQEIASLYVPQEFEQLAPQLSGFTFTIPCHGRCGGVVVRYPLAMLYLYKLQG